ncbi:MAG TPA: hypothetical protein VK338_05895, partial [Candidatus Nitrosocosmicus sp.]|nr:hypothetical protein [Candidatus Nitrosocosmicus sp.]
MDKSTEVLSSADIELRKTSSIAIFEESRANTREAHPNQDVVFSLNGDGGTLALLMDGVSTGAITPESLRKAVNQGSLVLRDITSGEIVKRLTSPNID